MGKLKFIYSEKAKKFGEIFTLLLTVCTVVKSKVKISQNFVSFSEYMNFDCQLKEGCGKLCVACFGQRKTICGIPL